MSVSGVVRYGDGDMQPHLHSRTEPSPNRRYLKLNSLFSPDTLQYARGFTPASEYVPSDRVYLHVLFVNVTMCSYYVIDYTLHCTAHLLKNSSFSALRLLVDHL